MSWSLCLLASASPVPGHCSKGVLEDQSSTQNSSTLGFLVFNSEIIYRLVKNGGFAGSRLFEWRVNNAFEAPMTYAMLLLDIACC